MKAVKKATSDVYVSQAIYTPSKTYYLWRIEGGSVYDYYTLNAIPNVGDAVYEYISNTGKMTLVDTVKGYYPNIQMYAWGSGGQFFTTSGIPQAGDYAFTSPEIIYAIGTTSGVISEATDEYIIVDGLTVQRNRAADTTSRNNYMLINNSNYYIQQTNTTRTIKEKYQLIPNPKTITIPNVSILGGLTFTDNILNNFSENNYAQLPQDLQFNTEGNQFDDSWEIVFKIKLNNEATTGTDSAIISTSLSRSYNPRLVVWNNLQVALLLTNSTNSWNVCEINSGDTYLTIGDWYWIKVTCLGWASSKSDYNLYISTDGTNYSGVGGKLRTNSYKATALKNIGFCHDNSNGDLNFKGEIDLSESYIKVNDNIWWEGTKELNIQ